ncbi:16S rRNA (cytosine(967)-C(5))-methyltransferase RsmB [Aneurinibacillus thermoaerophilus]|uniref:16S rRNA (cytosine(967)-C(5))-methyltransferase n=1 Tax=Aneurinibacillus thermoaerophilus TaxID=143495 RepID=A0A1G7WAP9_ANETH|nr:MULTISPECIES: 16S rRNA (cytosine(967)-C(5))-methyltransferase RsmB [Aneurinibacillus]AMA72610.1 16S rRNA methyltransferase [Aneurinibacillus sp. XH2]MED0680161.1 16S rRNA (cytosine(967)-C(5))-methyltransferase RsmB [Aneurinibacillus thermoaerophilus]MED0756731.1 16S rRNA (cytosine(967)-C(5))-methyltransferase RsmB [Aneurinibacillus thermoaerophilus]MED0760781.1 16S rRNA (cytosine(967)-C(5))-methyltransferase RsmB [Aneurinibacillus thermoaerophilus]MED0764603.1 16S rRNA (cytosine(967)-C(5))-
MSRRKKALPEPGNARELAVRVLTDIENRQAYSNLELKRVLEQTKLLHRDKALATELVYGTISRLYTLDWMLAQFVNQPLDKLEGWARNLLRISFYQLTYLDRIPAHAVVHEAVEIAKVWGHKGVAGMVNGVLRNRLRHPERVDIPADLPPVERIALVHSHPKWMVEEWLRRFGEVETENMCAANNQPPRLSLRANVLRATRDELIAQIEKQATDAEVEPSMIAPEGVIASDVGNIAELPAYTSGSCTVQDESSMLVARALAPEAGMRVLDMCAAPGGKTTHIAELMGNKGQIIALDVHPHKIKLIEANAFRLGISIIRARHGDARDAARLLAGETFDRILVDAPCTGLGVIRRKPDIKWYKWQEDARAISEIQYEILCAASRLAAPGSKIVYSTCTVQPEENIELVRRFLAGHPEWELDKSLIQDMPRALQEKYPTLVEGYVQILPHHFHTDGFFISRLKMKQ